MKKRAITLMLLTAVLVNSGITTNAAMINVDSESNVLQAKVSDSVKTIAVEDGKSVDIRNTSTDTVTIETDLSSYYSRTVDIVFYNKEGIVTKYEHNFIGEIKLEAGEKARLTVSCGKAITLIENLADSEKISIENLQDDVKALFRLSIESGKNYKIKNNNNLSFDIQTNGSSYYGRYYDLVKYNAQSAIDSFEHNSSNNSITLKQG